MNNKHRFQNLLSLLLLFLLIGGLWFLFTSRDAQRTDNPFEQRDTEVLPVYQEEHAKLATTDPDLPSEDTPELEEPDTEEPESDTEQESDPETELQSEPPQNETSLGLPEQPEMTANDNPSEDVSDSDSDSGEASTESSGNGNDTDGAGTDPSGIPSQTPAVLLPPADLPVGNDGVGDTEKETKLVYFTTNIINGSTITARELDVTITHKVSYLTPLSTTVELNGAAIQFNGHLLLEEGKNTIRITVVYADQEGHQIEVSKTYTIYVELEKVAITTDLSDRTINQRSFAFTAYASCGSQRIPLSVTVNGVEHTPSGNRYQAALSEGTNEIILYAANNDTWAKQTFYITVELPAEMQINTDLYDHEVDNPNFSFYAALVGGTENAALTVVANGTTLSGNESSYSCVLSRGNNFIRLKASDVNGAEYTMEYVISYHNYIVRESSEADETMPRIITNVSDGMSLSSTIYSLQVRGEDGSGQRIYGDHLAVELNGMTLEDRSEDGNTTYYQLDLSAGPNALVVTVWDYEDRYTIFRYSIYCDAVPEGTRIGSITVSVEATTVGLGYLIPPTTVDIYQGQNLVIPVATILEACGYQYQYSGSLENGFYLMHLIRDGITDGYHIPEDLVAAINRDGLMWTNEYYTRSLGEFDFTQGSGWMYTINGSSGMGMSDIYPADGDVVCLRYTLAYGRDIGLGMGADGNSYNYSQEW